jgi:hypothetical protein
VKTVANCIHTITDLDPSGHGRFSYWEIWRFGESASRRVARRMVTRLGSGQADCNRARIQRYLDIERYPIVWRPCPTGRFREPDR